MQRGEGGSVFETNIAAVHESNPSLDMNLTHVGEIVL